MIEAETLCTAAAALRPAVVPRDIRLRALVDQHFDVVWRSLRRLGVPPDAVDDAAQQVFIVASRKLDGIEARGERAYLLAIAVRVASDARRSRSRRREVPEPEDVERADPTPAPDELLDRKRARELLDRVLESMPLDLRAPFALFELEGLPLPEVAPILGVPLGTAASRLRRARQMFRERLYEASSTARRSQ